MQENGVTQHDATGAAGPAASATVVLARQAGDAAEFFLVQRHAGAAFGASYVFPGGLVETQDRHVHERCGGLSAGEADRCLGLPGCALDYYSAAIRELFEETGVLLVRDAAGRMPPAAAYPDPALQDRERRRLLAGEKSWASFLERHHLSLAADVLTYFAWWITPVERRRRFSTRFFLARMPEGQSALHDGRELTDGRWLTAAAALLAGQAGEITLPPPTAVTLRDLAAIPEFDELHAWAMRRSEAGVPRVLPIVVPADGGGERILMPGDPDYSAYAGGSG